MVILPYKQRERDTQKDIEHEQFALERVYKLPGDFPTVLQEITPASVFVLHREKERYGQRERSSSCSTEMATRGYPRDLGRYRNACVPRDMEIYIYTYIIFRGAAHWN